MANTYVQGQLVLLTVQFTGPNGLIDPTSTVFSVSDGAGHLTQPSVTHVSTGIFTCLFDTTNAAAGTVKYIAQGTGAVIAIAEGYFTLVAPSFVT